MKKRIALFLAGVSTLGSLQMAHADCNDAAYTARFLMPILIGTITSAPTATTLLIGAEACHREAVLNIKEAAIQHRLTGEVSELLRESILEGQRLNPALTEDQIVNKFITLQTQE